MLNTVMPVTSKGFTIFEGDTANSSIAWLPTELSDELVGTLTQVFLHKKDNGLALFLVKVLSPILDIVSRFRYELPL